MKHLNYFLCKLRFCHLIDFEIPRYGIVVCIKNAVTKIQYYADDDRSHFGKESMQKFSTETSDSIERTKKMDDLIDRSWVGTQKPTESK